jgi:divalent metal cation (Fe/Co/Zn/Cd) transporter
MKYTVQSPFEIIGDFCSRAHCRIQQLSHYWSLLYIIFGFFGVVIFWSGIQEMIITPGESNGPMIAVLGVSFLLAASLYVSVFIAEKK